MIEMYCNGERLDFRRDNPIQPVRLNIKASNDIDNMKKQLLRARNIIKDNPKQTYIVKIPDGINMAVANTLSAYFFATAADQITEV